MWAKAGKFALIFTGSVVGSSAASFAGLTIIWKLIHRDNDYVKQISETRMQIKIDSG